MNVDNQARLLITHLNEKQINFWLTKSRKKRNELIEAMSKSDQPKDCFDEWFLDNEIKGWV